MKQLMIITEEDGDGILYGMRMHQEVLLQCGGDDRNILRVPGGWVYTTYAYAHRISSVFVPIPPLAYLAPTTIPSHEHQEINQKINR